MTSGEARATLGGLAEASPREPRALTLLRVGSIRYAAFYYVMFYTAVETTGLGGPFWIVAGAGLCAFFSLGIELLNRHTDRHEDAINNPRRTAMCERVGYGVIWRLLVADIALMAVVGAVWVWTFRRWAFVAALFVVAFVAINYSYGLRFKGRRYAALVALSSTILLPFLGGWSMQGDFRELPPVLLAAGLFIASIAGAKDITDEAGDLERGYRSAYLSLLRVGAARLVGILMTPYLVLGALVVLGWAPVRMLWLMAFLPGSLLLGAATRAARTTAERAGARELTYHLWMLFLAACAYLIHPAPRLGAVLAASLVFWFFASRYVHWTKGPTKEQLVTAFGPRASPRALP